MTHLTPKIIAEVTGGTYVGTPEYTDNRITGAVRDNREVQPGNLFVCIRGERVDGHDFANAAFDAGASCCLTEREIPDARGPYVHVKSTLEALKTLGAYYRRQFTIPIIGVTGSVGKTTAKEMVAAALSARLSVLKTPANLNNEIGVPLTLLSLTEHHDAAVIEMGISEFGEMSRLAEMVRPDICLMTKIGYSHLETLIDLPGVLRAKSEVFAYMPENGVAVVCGDDELLYAFDPGLRKLTFGLGADNDYRAENVTPDGIDAVTCDVVGDGRGISARIPAYGRQMALSALPAVAIARLLGLPDDEICAGLLTYKPVGGRANAENIGFMTLIDDCYNANPNSMREAIASLAMLTGRRVAILGDMFELGIDSAALHREIGRLAGSSGLDAVICCGSQAIHIYNGALEAGADARYFPHKYELLVALPELISEGDIVLVKASHGMHFEELTSRMRDMI